MRIKALSDFTHAVIDDEGEIVRKYRWSKTEVKYFTDNLFHGRVVRLKQSKPEQQISQYELAFEDCGESLF
jgi:hypothetical protein